MRSATDTRNVAICGLLAALTAVGAFLKINIGHVPLTLQTLFVYLSGSLLTPGYAAAAQGTYVACGLIGLPVFTSPGGPASVLHPTFGYLAAFPLASSVISALIGAQIPRGNGKKAKCLPWTKLVYANGIGAVLVFTLGVVYLYMNLNYITHTAIPLKSALWAGCVVFIPGEIIKIAIATTITHKLYYY